MSHLTPSTPTDTDIISTVEYSKADRKVRRRYITSQITGWFIALVAISMLIWSIADHAWFMLAGTLVLMASSISYLTKLGEIRSEYRPVKLRRQYTRRVFRFVREHYQVETMELSSRATYMVDFELHSKKARVFGVNLGHVKDAMLLKHRYEITPTRVTTIQGPVFSEILPDLERMFGRSDDYGEADQRIGNTFQASLRDQLPDTADVNGHEPFVTP